jgi:site-specific DNA-cytosine methylase
MLNVLSLFDGLSGGQIALNKAGIKYDSYYASEVDPHAIKVANFNYPNTIHIGDVTQVKSSELPDIQLLIGGSPCQGFSFAGKQLNFDDPRSKLFFEYVRLLEECKPQYFLLENVRMKKESEDVITSILGVKPIEINSSLLSGQLRKRLYWTNIPDVTMPIDKGIVLKDLLESGSVDRDKSLCLTARYAGYQGSQSYLRRRYFGKSMGQAVFENTTPSEQKEMWKEDPYQEFETNGRIRALTIREMERLQTLPEGYVNGLVSDSEAKKMIGNGWTIDVIAHFFKNINDDILKKN